MSNNNFIVRKAAVLGAGVMGAQIAAHLVNANVETLLFELPGKQGDPNANGDVTGLNALLVNIPQKKVRVESWKHN